MMMMVMVIMVMKMMMMMIGDPQHNPGNGTHKLNLQFGTALFSPIIPSYIMPQSSYERRTILYTNIPERVSNECEMLFYLLLCFWCITSSWRAGKSGHFSKKLPKIWENCCLKSKVNISCRSFVVAKPNLFSFSGNRVCVRYGLNLNYNFMCNKF